MRSVFLRRVATLLLTVICAHFCHVLAEGMADGRPAAACMASVLARGGESGCPVGHGHGHGYGHNHDHSLSCDQWLCSGFSGGLLATEALRQPLLDTAADPFADGKTPKFDDRKVKPPIAPPRRA